MENARLSLSVCAVLLRVRKVPMMQVMSEDELRVYKEQLDAMREDLKIVVKYSNSLPALVSPGTDGAARPVSRCRSSTTPWTTTFATGGSRSGYPVGIYQFPPSQISVVTGKPHESADGGRSKPGASSEVQSTQIRIG
jgi:hypothetical protein